MVKDKAKTTSDKLDQLSVEWARIDGQGLVRVVPVDRYRTGFVVIAKIGPLAERYDYYPDMLLGADKVTITIDDANEDTAFALAAAIDKVLTVEHVGSDSRS